MGHKIPEDYAFQLTNPSLRTIRERNKFAAQLDDFATFQWCGYDMFEEFGAFIINDKKGSLKMYNGASFKNQYSKQQFQDGYVNLTGVTFEQQKIQFTIGVYWISIEDYRVLMNLLHPYEINMLSFSFEKTYGYGCKLESIKDSTRYVVGKEDTNTSTANTNLDFSRLNSGNTSGPRYYTELQLTFEVVGRQCAMEKSPRIITGTCTQNPSNEPTRIVVNNDNYISDLDYPFTLQLHNIKLINPNETGIITATAEIRYTNPSDPTTVSTNHVSLFQIGLKNLQNSIISLAYDSNKALLYWSLGGKQQLLTLLSTLNNGQRMVDYITLEQCYWPGRLGLPIISDCTCEIQLQFENIVFNQDIEGQNNNLNIYIYTARRCTNVI